MKKALTLLTFVLVLIESVVGQSFEEKTTTASNMRLNVTNVGTLGNAFRGYRDGSGRQSCEYPAGSGVEHLFEGGIWIGGLIDGNTVAVSTSAYDAPSGYSTGRGGFEFTAELGSTLEERSSLFDSPFFTPDALSHQDYVSTFSDRNLVVPGTSIPISGHLQPMNLEVRMETYNWNYAFSDFFVILNFEVTNRSNAVIDSVYFGLWTNTVVRNLNVTPAGSGGAAFYNKGGNGYLDSLQLAYCYDHSGDVGFTESYIGQKFLGAEDKNGFQHPTIRSGFKAHYNAWEFNNTSNPVFFLPATEQARYTKLTKGLNDDLCWDKNSTQNAQCGPRSYQEQLNEAGNRSDLVSVGPFRSLAPGESFKATYALVAGKKLEDGKPNSDNNSVQQTIFRTNANWAQVAFNGEDKNFNGQLDEGEDIDGNGSITRFILPAPPDIPKTRIVTRDHEIDVYWSDNSERSVDPITRELDFEGYRVYMTQLGFDVTDVPDLARDMKRIAEYDLRGNGLFSETGFESVRLEQPVRFENDTTSYRFKYTIRNIQNGWQYAIAVSAFDRGNEASNLESLESSLLANNFRAFAGKPVNANLKTNEPFAYPNPYYYGAAWEGTSNFQEQSRKIYFANLPQHCKIRIFTQAGDLIDEIHHDAEYNGTDIRWYQTFGSENPERNVHSGGEHGWDLLSTNSQIIARGLYIFTVEDLESGSRYQGKFVIIK
ncbi:MAG: hypothetical protein H6606_10200 [Flavobacteriales bacterium]|nr:hypothetical protein [Flavobacteriales bacterium]